MGRVCGLTLHCIIFGPRNCTHLLDLDFDNYSDCVFLLCYRMSLYIQILTYMHLHNSEFYTDLTTPFLILFNASFL